MTYRRPKHCPEWLDDLTDPRTARWMLEACGYYSPHADGDREALKAAIREALDGLATADLVALRALAVILAGDTVA